MSKLFFTLLITSIFYSEKSLSQDYCDIRIDDTLKIKKAYIITYTDTTQNNNTKYRSLSFFISKKKDFKNVSELNIFEYCIYLPSQNFINYLLANDRNLFNKVFENKTNYGDITKKKIKEKGMFTLYSIESKKGFISWSISNQKFNEGLSIESIKIPNNVECLKVVTPNNIE